MDNFIEIPDNDINFTKDLEGKYIIFDKSENKKSKRIFNVSNEAHILYIGFSNESGEINVNLNKENASVKIETVLLGLNSSINLDILVNHNASNTLSVSENYITSNKSKIKLNIVGKIEKGKSKSVCKQKSRGIIISDGSIISVKPTLLIDENDVLANHACAIGKIDEESLYYLMSRGLNLHDAELLIINGFLDPILKSINEEKIRDELKLIFKNKL